MEYLVSILHYEYTSNACEKFDIMKFISYSFMRDKYFIIQLSKCIIIKPSKRCIYDQTQIHMLRNKND
jgi:hypothetical protein